MHKKKYNLTYNFKLFYKYYEYNEAKYFITYIILYI